MIGQVPLILKTVMKGLCLPKATNRDGSQGKARTLHHPPCPGVCLFVTYCSWILWMWSFCFNLPFTSYNLLFSFRTVLWNKQPTVKSNRAGGGGWISHLLCTWAIDFESFIHQIVESSWISANWQLNFTFPECSGNISAWIFFSNTGAGNKKLVGQWSYKNCKEL